MPEKKPHTLTEHCEEAERLYPEVARLIAQQDFDSWRANRRRVRAERAAREAELTKSPEA